MLSSFDPEYAPVGDVGTALLYVDSLLTRIREGASQTDPKHRELVDEFFGSFSSEDAGDVLDGACTLVYLYMEWLRQAHEEQGRDVFESVVPYVVGSMRKMTISIRPEAIPAMAGMLTASAIGLSPTLWRKQYGPWTEAEMNALEATLVLLADYINHLTNDETMAIRMIADIMESLEQSCDAV
jgi:hypothetical protein